MSKSNLDVEGRERARRKEELLTLKKRAAWIAKEVSGGQVKGRLVTTATIAIVIKLPLYY